MYRVLKICIFVGKGEKKIVLYKKEKDNEKFKLLVILKVYKF